VSNVSLVKRPRKTPAIRPLLAIADNELPRHPDIAYEDGYSDAKYYGKDGYFISSRYNEDARIRYLQGFQVGLRLYNLSSPS